VTDTEDLLTRARADKQITSLPAESIRGAEAYFQAYQYVAAGHLQKRTSAIRRMAAKYLKMTASPPFTPEQERAAVTARGLLKQLS
jgi:hypothetical protein